MPWSGIDLSFIPLAHLWSGHVKVLMQLFNYFILYVILEVLSWHFNVLSYHLSAFSPSKQELNNNVKIKKKTYKNRRLK